jgi:hypothetical protein
MLERKRWSRGSAETQTGQEQPIMGTPLLVPVPKNVMERVGAIKRLSGSCLSGDLCSDFFEEFPKILRQDHRIDRQLGDQLHQGIDAPLCLKKFVQHNYFFGFQDAIATLEIAAFITKNVTGLFGNGV